MSIKYFKQRPYSIILLMCIFVFLTAIKIYNYINIYSIIGLGALSFMTVSLTYYLLFINKLTLEVDEEGKYLTVYKNNNLLKRYKTKEIKTDPARWAYILDNNLILFRGIAESALEKKNLNLDMLQKINSISILSDQRLFFYLFAHNKYFRWNIIVFFSMPIGAIVSQVR